MKKLNFNDIFIECSDENSEYSIEAPSCPLNCETLGNACTNRTVSNPGCTCKPTMVLNCQGFCVSATSYCRKCPGDNEYYSECNRSPEASCKNPNQPSTGIQASCVCRKGYIRNYSNKCVLLEECPSELTINNRFSFKCYNYFLILIFSMQRHKFRIFSIGSIMSIKL